MFSGYYRFITHSSRVSVFKNAFALVSPLGKSNGMPRVLTAPRNSPLTTRKRHVIIIIYNHNGRMGGGGGNGR